MRFAICNELFESWDFRRQVEFVKATGYDGLELAPFTFADSVTEISADRRKELKKIAADAGLELTGLHWLLVKPPGLHLTSPDKAIRAKTVDYLKQLIDFCGDLGAKFMVFGSPNQRVFSVVINGQTVLSDFDIVAQGGRNAAVDRTFQVQSSGQINIHFASTIDDPVISAIEIN